MNDPYKTPQSDLEISQPVSKTKWKVFFWIVIILEIISIVSMINDPEETILEIIFESVVYFMIILGLFGFAYNKRIFFSKLWVSMIPVGLTYDIYSIYTLDMTFESTEEIYFVIAFTAVLIIPLVFFQYYALYKYSLKSPAIWQ